MNAKTSRGKSLVKEYPQEGHLLPAHRTGETTLPKRLRAASLRLDAV